eukprot:764470-Hanusia_phi.AAC.1
MICLRTSHTGRSGRSQAILSNLLEESKAFCIALSKILFYLYTNRCAEQTLRVRMRLFASIVKTARPQQPVENLPRYLDDKTEESTKDAGA